MLARQHRLSTERFIETISKGKAFHSPLFLMRALETGAGVTRVAAVVPVKVGKTATVRSAMRRRMYASVAKELPRLKEGLDIILLAKALGSKGAAGLKGAKQISHTVAAINADLRVLFVKAGIVR